MGLVTVCTVNTLQYCQCIVDARSSSASGVGNTLTVNLNLTFKNGPFLGAKNVYSQTQDTGGLGPGWQHLGTWTVNGPMAPTAASVTPSSGIGASHAVSFVYSEANAVGGLPWGAMLFNTSL